MVESFERYVAKLKPRCKYDCKGPSRFFAQQLDSRRVCTGGACRAARMVRSQRQRPVATSEFIKECFTVLIKPASHATSPSTVSSRAVWSLSAAVALPRASSVSRLSKALVACFTDFGHRRLTDTRVAFAANSNCNVPRNYLQC